MDDLCTDVDSVHRYLPADPIFTIERSSARAEDCRYAKVCPEGPSTGCFRCQPGTEYPGAGGHRRCRVSVPVTVAGTVGSVTDPWAPHGRSRSGDCPEGNPPKRGPTSRTTNPHGSSAGLQCPCGTKRRPRNRFRSARRGRQGRRAVFRGGTAATGRPTPGRAVLPGRSAAQEPAKAADSGSAVSQRRRLQSATIPRALLCPGSARGCVGKSGTRFGVKGAWPAPGASGSAVAAARRVELPGTACLTPHPYQAQIPSTSGRCSCRHTAVALAVVT